MENRYKIVEEDECIVIEEQNSGYKLILKDPKTDMGPVCFTIPTPNLPNIVLPNWLKGSRVWVTGRALKDYSPDGALRMINPHSQYCEIGSGFGAFLQNLVRISSRASPKPIAIDLFDYELGEKMLLLAKEDLHLSQTHIQEIDAFIQRKKLITNPERIYFINATLGEAIRLHPEILGKVDFLVDACGAFTYADTEMFEDGVLKVQPNGNYKQALEDRVEMLEKQLLKKDGRIIRFPTYQ